MSLSGRGCPQYDFGNCWVSEDIHHRSASFLSLISEPESQLVIAGGDSKIP